MGEEEKGGFEERNEPHIHVTINQVGYSEEVELSHPLHQAEQGSDNAKELDYYVGQALSRTQYKEDVQTCEIEIKSVANKDTITKDQLGFRLYCNLTELEETR